MTERTERGTFAPGSSGNPKGRPADPNSARQLRERLAEHGPQVIEAMLDKALKGDVQAARLVLERVCPPLRPQAAPAAVTLPDNGNLADLARAFIDQTAAGDLPSDQAAAMVQAVGTLARVVETSELEERLARLEEELAR